MKLADAVTRFLEHARLKDSTDNYAQSLTFLTEYFSSYATLSDLTPSSLRDFFSRWYVEKPPDSTSTDSASVSRIDSSPLLTDRVLPALELFDSIEEFIGWADQRTGAGQAAELSPVLSDLRCSLPRAFEITSALTSALRARGGAFTFPEFLTSFEGGGSSQYDIDVPGHVGAIDGYLRIIRAEGSLVEAEELISEARVWPIIFPAEVAGLLEEGYIINLELVRNAEGWQIAGCGFAYPPGTELDDRS